MSRGVAATDDENESYEPLERSSEPENSRPRSDDDVVVGFPAATPRPCAFPGPAAAARNCVDEPAGDMTMGQSGMVTLVKGGDEEDTA